MTTNGNLTIAEACALATKELSENKTIDSPRLDCEVILSHILKCERIDLILNGSNFLKKEHATLFFDMIKKRKNNTPVSYITGVKEFMSLDFFAQEGVLIPRPETEILVEKIIAFYKDNKIPEILDLCTGSGAIAVSLAHYLKKAKVFAIDKFDICVETAEKNAKIHNVSDRCNIIKGDVLDDFSCETKFDCIVSNPPYIKKDVLSTLPKDVKDFEPDYALDGGDDGLIFYRKIVEIAKTHLKDGGLLAFEIGFDQGEDVKYLIDETRVFQTVLVEKDYANQDRIVMAIKGLS